ncbi:MAG: PDZ domain-containing protein [Arachnia sp.]
MSRNVVAVVSSVLFVTLAALLVVIPAPFVTWRPGQTVDVLGSTDDGRLIEVVGVPTYESEGELLMTTVSTTRVDSSVSLPEALLAFALEDSYALPREIVYPAGQSTDQVQAEAVEMMTDSRDNAVVAALRAAGVTVTEMPMVGSVTLSGPANDKLVPGDLIASVDGQAVTVLEDIQAIVRDRTVGDPVVFDVLRDGQEVTVSVVTAANAESEPSVGITVRTGFVYAPEVVFRIDSSVVGPSAGLVFALAIYEELTESTIVGDLVVAGTGEIDPTGQVGAIGGVRQKIKGAEDGNASVFILPEANCNDIGGLDTSLRLVPVANLKEAIAALQLLRQDDDAEVPTCDR